MSEASTAVAEEVVTQPESTPSTPPSEAVVEQPLEAPSGTGVETPGTGEGESTPEPTTAVDPEERYKELAAKVGKVDLTAAEGQELQRLGQSLGDKRAQEQDRINKARKTEAEVTTAATNLLGYAQQELDAIEDRENKLAEYEGRAPSPARIKAEQKQLLQTFKERGEIIHQWPIHLDLNERIRAQQPPSARLEEWLTDPRTPIKDKVDFLEAIPRAPSKDHVIIPKKEYEAQLKAAAKKAQDDLKSANPDRYPSTGGGKPAGGNLTLAQIDAMPTQEWLGYSREERTRLLDAAHRAAGR